MFVILFFLKQQWLILNDSKRSFSISAEINTCSLPGGLPSPWKAAKMFECALRCIYMYIWFWEAYFNINIPNTILPILHVSIFWLSVCCTREGLERTILLSRCQYAIYELILSASQMAEGPSRNFPSYLLPLLAYKIKCALWNKYWYWSEYRKSLFFATDANLISFWSVVTDLANAHRCH